MNRRSSAIRWLLLLTAILLMGGILVVGSRHPPAVASCEQQTAGADVAAGEAALPLGSSQAATARGCPTLTRPITLEPAQTQMLTPGKLADALALALAPSSAGGTSLSMQTSLPSGGRNLAALLAASNISTSGFIWPVVGPVTQPFGVPELGVGTPHTGLDIGEDAGTPVRASQAGRVVFAGGDPCCGLGYWIEINHGNHYATRYGHLMRPPLLLPGDYVNQGQIIGFSGTTGFSTGPHVHLEVRLDGVPIDPLRVLPRR